MIETQLRNLDEAKEAKQVGTPHHASFAVLPPGANGEGTAQVDPQRWATSDADAARYTNWFRMVRREKGEALAIRELREELDRDYVPPDKVQREIERIQRLAESP